MPLAPAIATIAELPVATLDYAQPQSPPPDLVAVGLHQLLLVVSGLSGLCVGSCFLVLRAPGDAWPKWLHLLIYGLTLTFAFIAGARPVVNGPLFRAVRLRMALDLCAGAGLLVIAFAPLAIDDGHLNLPPFGLGVLGIAYACMAAATWRHILLYQGLAALSRVSGRTGQAKALAALGIVKFIYETLWLSICALPLLFYALPESAQQYIRPSGGYELIDDCAFGALFGCLGFGGIWLAMMIVHAVCAGSNHSGRRRPERFKIANDLT